MISFQTLVSEFCEKFGRVKPASPILDVDKLGFRVRHLQEELNEICEASDDGDLSGVADGLIDLVYVALGACHDLGLPTEKLFEEIHRANMAKVATLSGSKRTGGWDVVKPEGWVAPDVSRVLKEAGL